MQGKIIKGIGGLYYVHGKDGVLYECAAKGIFRKDNIKPLVGDDAEIDILDEKERKGNISALLPRKNVLIRPAVANVDQALVIFAMERPEPNFNLLDRFLVAMQRQQIPCIICFNKKDLEKGVKQEELIEAYGKTGQKLLFVSALQKDGMDELTAQLLGKTTTVAGPSGVGKSSIVNGLLNRTAMETGELSEKIERGKHTTRHSELLSVGGDTYIMDTPGFSSMGLFEMEKEQLATCYPEFTEYEKSCRFRVCAHINEPDCGVKEALAEGKISRLRYDNYVLLYEELKNQKKRR